MQYLRIIILTLILWLGFKINPIFAQKIERSVLSSAYYSDPDIGEWVVGETLISDLEGARFKVSSGFLQGDILSTGFSPALDPFFSFEVYPNPFSQIIYLRHNASSICSVEIRDVFGRIVYKRDIIGPESSIDLFSHPTGTYFLIYQTRHSAQRALPIYKIQ